MPTPHIPRALERKPGLIYARTANGEPLPVIDVTNAAFRVCDDLTAVETMRNEFAATERKRKQLPKFLLRYFIRSAARRSHLARALFNPEGGVLPGLNTYPCRRDDASEYCTHALQTCSAGRRGIRSGDQGDRIFNRTC